MFARIVLADFKIIAFQNQLEYLPKILDNGFWDSTDSEKAKKGIKFSKSQNSVWVPFGIPQQKFSKKE